MFSFCPQPASSPLEKVKSELNPVSADIVNEYTLSPIGNISLSPGFPKLPPPARNTPVVSTVWYPMLTWKVMYTFPAFASQDSQATPSRMVSFDKTAKRLV